MQLDLKFIEMEEEVWKDTTTPQLEGEVWKDLKGYEGLYQISSYGRVKSLERLKNNHDGHQTVSEKILSSNPWNHGHLKVNLAKDGKNKTYSVHRLVALAFIPNPEGKPEIDHIDTNPKNNCVDNLRWVTRKENQNNPSTLKHMSECHKGEKSYWYGKLDKDHCSSIPIVQLTMDGKYIRTWDSTAQVSRELGYDHGNVNKVLKNKRLTSYGYRWMYLSDYNKEGTVA